MNIEDIKEKPEKVENVMEAIFNKQEKIMIKYKDMGDTPPWPLELDLMEHQTSIKDFKQRGMEEIAEAIEAFRQGERLHFVEELIDALHFFVELNILVDKKHDFFNYTCLKSASEKPITLAKLYMIYGKLGEKYGLLCNTLKNKPWKNTQISTDKAKFYKLLKESFEYFMFMLYESGFDLDSVHQVYFKKHKVNEFRIRSNY